MKLNAMLVGLAVLVASVSALAADYPTKPVTIIVPFAAGGTVDSPMRALAQRLSEQTGTPFMVENRPGAGGTTATAAVAARAADDHVLLATTSATPISQAFYKNAGFDAVKSFRHIAMIGTTPTVLVVGTKAKATSLQEVVAELKARPGTLSYGSPGFGTASHLAAELLKQHLGVDMLHVPYKGAGPAMNDVLSGQIDILVAGLSASAEHVKRGALRAVAVTTLQRHPLLPDVPSVAEIYPGYEFLPWIGLSAPADVPAPIVRWLSEQVRLALDSPPISRRFRELGVDPTYLSPAEFSARIDRDTKHFAQVVLNARISVD